MRNILTKLWSSPALGWRILRITVFGYLALLAMLMIFEEKLIYHPSPASGPPPAIRPETEVEGEIVPLIEDVFFPAADGVRLHGWYCRPVRKQGGRLEPLPGPAGIGESENRSTGDPPPSPDSPPRPSGLPVLIWFHGNALSVDNRYDMIRMLIAIPVEIFIIDYRGFGRSEGSPSEEGLYRAADGAWDWLTKTRGIPPGRIVIFGKSLGGGPAVDLAARVEAAGLIVQSCFTSMPDMAGEIYPFVPRFLVRTQFDSIGKIGRVKCPKLHIHGTADEIIPFRLGRRLFDAAPEPKAFYEVPGAGHNNVYLDGGEAYLERLREFVRGCVEK